MAMHTQAEPEQKSRRLPWGLRLLAVFCALLLCGSVALGVASTAKLTLDMTTSLREQMATECLQAGLGYLQANRYEQALEYLQAVLDLRPNDPEAQALRGNVYIATGEYDKAMECLQSAIAAYGDAVPSKVLLQLASLYVLQNDLAAATPLLEQITEQDPTESNGWLLLGQIYYEDKNYSAALECFDKYLVDDPTNATALAVRAACRSATGDETRAMEDLVQAAEYAKDNPEIRIALAEVYTSLGRYDQAAEAYRMAVEADPTNPDSRQALGACLLYVGRYDEAEQAYRDALEALGTAQKGTDDERLIRFSLAVTLEQEGKLPEAIELLETLAETDFETLTVQAQLAECYAATEDRADEALPLLDSLLAEDTLTEEERATLLVRAANVSLTRGEYDRAVEYADTCLEKAPDNAEAMLYRAVANLQTGKYPSALADLDVLVQASPQAAQIRYYRALANIQLQNTAAAREDLQACAADADEPEIAQAAQALLDSMG